MLDPGLYLIGLGRLVSEALDELLGFLDHSLLVLVGSLLLGKSFLAQFEIFAVRNLIVMDTSDHDFNRAVGHVVKEFSVMGNQDKGTAAILQIGFEPLN